MEVVHGKRIGMFFAKWVGDPKGASFVVVESWDIGTHKKTGKFYLVRADQLNEVTVGDQPYVSGPGSEFLLPYR
jgi:CRISPR/Cas system CMR-associated protein Cmr3 (group 5 of RAMP superfamily)